MERMKCIGLLTSKFSDHLWGKINAITTVASAKSSSEDMTAATELDSHADSPVVGKNAIILESLNRCDCRSQL
jgi:hypothetical protein